MCLAAVGEFKFENALDACGEKVDFLAPSICGILYAVLDLGRPQASDEATQQNAATKPRRSTGMSESSTVTAPEST